MCELFCFLHVLFFVVCNLAIVCCFSSKVVLTGQENHHCDTPMREDLCKKVMSADLVPCRLPFGILTKMITFERWTRFEMSEPMAFRSVPERSFNSILRRSLVINLKGRFISEEVFASLTLPSGVATAADIGCCEIDTDLPAFLRSGPTGAAVMCMVAGWATDHSQRQCEYVVESYAGGDLTRDTMRNVCNLAPLPRTENKNGPA